MNRSGNDWYHTTRSGEVMDTIGAIVLGAVVLVSMMAYGRYAASSRLRRALPETGGARFGRVFRCGGTIHGRLYTGVMVTVRVTEDSVELEFPGGRLNLAKDRITGITVRRRTLGASLVIRYSDPDEIANEPEAIVELDSAYAERIRDAIES